MQPRHLVVVGASAGGIEALRLLVANLPDDFPAAAAVVMHTAPQSPGVLHEILSRSGPLPVLQPRTGERLRPGHIYVAPPDHHLLVEPGRLRVTKGPRENRFRPAIDPLFRSAAQVFGPRAIGVILTGNLDDGTAGLWTIKQLGGVAVVQDPADAMFPSMPMSALVHVRVDHAVPLAEIAPLLVRLTGAPVPVEEPAPAGIQLETLEVEVDIAKERDPLDAGLRRIAKPSTFACPECHGVLLQLEEGGRIRFRCHTGHAFSAETLLAAIDESIEEAIWSAIRVLQEGSMLTEQLAEHVRSAHDAGKGSALLARARDLRHQADAIRQLATEREASPAKP
jgi:two-component system chemotaxis response regulator CheB